MNSLPALFRTTRGATMVDYGIMVGLVSALSIVVIALTGRQLDQTFDTASSEISEAGGQQVDTGTPGPDLGEGPFTPDPALPFDVALFAETVANWNGGGETIRGYRNETSLGQPTQTVGSFEGNGDLRAWEFIGFYFNETTSQTILKFATADAASDLGLYSIDCGGGAYDLSGATLSSDGSVITGIIPGNNFNIQENAALRCFMTEN